MSISWSDVTDIAPDLEDAPAGLRTKILRQVDYQIDDTVWGDLSDDGRIYLAAHLGTLWFTQAGAVSAAGPVSSESIGPMSRSYAVPSNSSGDDDSGLSLTRFGLEYKRLRALRAFPLVP